ncbi:MAG: hypothetical protein V7731_17095 [Amphritea sp.]
MNGLVNLSAALDAVLSAQSLGDDVAILRGGWMNGLVNLSALDAVLLAQSLGDDVAILKGGLDERVS